MKDQKGKSQSTEIGGKSTRPASLSRRTLLKAGVTAMPVVLTLQSGAALARSSNLISAAPGARDGDRNALCLDTTYSDPLGRSGKYDLGYDGTTVNVIPDVDYYPGSEGGTSGVFVGTDVFCQDGGLRKYQDAGWNYVDLPTNGIVVSSVALNSVGSRTTIFRRYWTDLS